MAFRVAIEQRERNDTKRKRKTLYTQKLYWMWMKPFTRGFSRRPDVRTREKESYLKCQETQKMFNFELAIAQLSPATLERRKMCLVQLASTALPISIKEHQVEWN